MTPIYPLFLASRGLDLFEINLVLAAYFVCVFLFEVPTGALADLFGRKLSFVLSCLIRAMAFSMYAWAESFADCLVAEVVDAFGTTLATGALDAWLVDELDAEGSKKPTAPIFAKGLVIARVVATLSGLGGAYLATTSISLPWFTSAALFAATALFALLRMQERPATSRRDHGQTSFGGMIREGFQIAYRRPLVRRLCILTFATAFASMPANLTWPALLQERTNEGFWLLGWVWALLCLAGGVGAALTTPALRRMRRGRLLALAQALRGIGFLSGALSRGFAPALAGLMTREAALAVSDPAAMAWANEHIDARLRATVLSVWSMAFTVGGATGGVLLGLLARAAGIPAMWTVSALILLATAPGFLRLDRERQARDE